MNFALHPQLAQDCFTLGRLELCRLLLLNDSQFPWFILVPEIANISEIYHLNKLQRGMLMEESCLLAEKLNLLFRGDKLNIAAIGNMVPQLHVHHVVRYQNDKAWPAPVWGKYTAQPYTGDQISEIATLMRVNLGLNAVP